MIKNTAILLILLFTFGCLGPTENNLGNNLVLMDPGDTEYQIIRKAASVAPSVRQLEWQKYEMTAFVHFTINTFTDKEWGDGNEDPALFNPTDFDARQWVKVCRDAGLKLVIVTAKHHDGFCLWPSDYTDHSVKSSPWMNGRGDVVGEVAAACKEFDLKFGVYLSPWDRHEQSYGTEDYNTYFKNQLTELLTNYGEVAEVWFDGANGEGPNGKRQVYDWEAYYSLIRELQPNAVIAIAGPDVRWVGTESGYGRETEWSVVPASNLDQEVIATQSQTDLNIRPELDPTEKDLGSRKKLENSKALVWYPSEVDVSIRPGWFYHASQDEQVKTAEKLLDIYFNSVGMNSVLLLNLPPDRRGLIHENDILSLQSFKRVLDQTFSENLAEGGRILPNVNTNVKRSADLYDDNISTCWASKATQDSSILEWTLPEVRRFNVLMLQENIQAGQRIESFLFQVWENEQWKTVSRGTTVGYKRLLKFPAVEAQRVRVFIESSRMRPTIAELGLFLLPPALSIDPKGGVFVDSVEVRLKSDDPDATIFYTLDGSDPGVNSRSVSGPVIFKESTELKAMAVSKEGKSSFMEHTQYVQSGFGITFDFPPSPKYNGGGSFGMIDGLNASRAFDDGKWTGFEAWDLIATVDIGEAQSISEISIWFLEDVSKWIFFPESVWFEISQDGTNFIPVFNELNTASGSENTQAEIRQFAAQLKNQKARYIRVIAKNRGLCPEWHPGAGGEAWIFADEITIK